MATENPVSEEKIVFDIVRSFIHIDNVLASIISHYFTLPNKRGLFKKEIMDKNKFGYKYELFKKINVIENILNPTEISDLLKLSQIRNCIAHNNRESGGGFLLNLDGKDTVYTIQELYKTYLDIAHSTGVKLEGILSKYVNGEKISVILKDLAMVYVSVRNFKGWFMDIYDLEIENSNGDIESINYPEHNYHIDTYEKDIESDITEYLKDKYGVEPDTYNIEITQDWNEQAGEDEE